MSEVKQDKVIVSLSGGLDSTVLLYSLVSTRGAQNVKALTVDYGQRHRREIDHARKITDTIGVEHRVVDLSPLRALMWNSALTNDEVDVPKGHYEDESMKQTVVPNRNMLLLSVAAVWAISEGANTIAYAAHAGDDAIYPDCRTVFANAMEGALGLCHSTPIVLERPFVNRRKEDLVTLGRVLGVPFEETWSCYEGGLRHCGLCGTCCERKEAFSVAGVNDRTEYLA